MRHVFRTEGPFPFDVVVNTTRSNIGLALAFHDEDDDIDDENVAVLLSPADAARLIIMLRAAVLESIKSGDEERGLS